MGYVWCDGYVWDMCGVRYVWDMCGVRYVWDMCGVRYVWDMCGVRYANNLLKNPATKRLSGIKTVAHIIKNQEAACPAKSQRTHQVSGTLDETLEIRGGIRPWVAWVACRLMVGRQHAGPRLVCSVAMDFILPQRW